MFRLGQRAGQLPFILCAVPNQLCPACDKPTARPLHDASKLAYVNYYRCEGCGHVWTTSRYDEQVVHHVTPLPQTPHRKSA